MLCTAWDRFVLMSSSEEPGERANDGAPITVSYHVENMEIRNKETGEGNTMNHSY
jgi:hypothetical protein